MYLESWDDNYIQVLKRKRNVINSIIGKFCSNINNKNLCDLFNSIDRINDEDFFEIIEKYKVYDRIDDRVINKLINNTYYLEIFLKSKNAVQKYANTIKKLFIKYKDSAEILLDEYVGEKIEGKRKYIPEQITLEEKEQIILSYIRFHKANYNYLKMIVNVKSKGNELIISDKTKLLAKKRVERETKEIIHNSKESRKRY